MQGDTPYYTGSTELPIDGNVDLFTRLDIQNRMQEIYTGGTIGMGCNPATGALEPLDFEHLADNVPEFKLIPTAIDTYQFIPAIDSSNMSPKNWADYCENNS